MLKQFILIIASVIILCLMLQIPIYKNWYRSKIHNYYREFHVQKNDLSIDARYRYRFGKNYDSNQNLKNYFLENRIENPVILLPPKEYLKKSTNSYDWGETLSFYYFTGVKPVDLKSDDINLATHAVTAKANGMQIIPIGSDEMLQRIIDEYKSYMPK